MRKLTKHIHARIGLQTFLSTLTLYYYQSTLTSTSRWRELPETPPRRFNGTITTTSQRTWIKHSASHVITRYKNGINNKTTKNVKNWNNDGNPTNKWKMTKCLHKHATTNPSIIVPCSNKNDNIANIILHEKLCAGLNRSSTYNKRYIEFQTSLIGWWNFR